MPLDSLLNHRLPRAALFAAIAVAALVHPVSARSRHFAVPSQVPQEPLPRSGPVFYSLGLGADYLYSRWRELYPHTTVSDHGGPAIQFRFGVPVGERLVFFLQADATLLLVGSGPWLGMAGIGLGATAFLPDDRWHLDFAIRKAWAQTVTDVGQLTVPPTVSSISDVWLGELGIGRGTRRGRIDRGISLSLFGGSMRPRETSGWAIGMGLLYSWSRS
jgi:hypothetical protein